MVFARTCARALGVGLVGLVGAAQAQPVLFTGDAEADFGAGAVVIADPNQIDVGMPMQFPQGTISGNDIKDIRLSYDAAADVMYIGLNMYVIGTDVDSQAGPDVTGPILAGLGGADVAAVGGTESFALVLDVDEDGTPDLIVGVSGATDINGFTAASFAGSVFAPGFAFGAPLPAHTGAVVGAPSAAMPDLEFTVPNWSSIPTSSGGDLSVQFAFNGFVGSFSDAGIGEDFTPGVNQFVTVCIPQEEACNEMDDDCDGDIDEGFNPGQACSVGTGACEANGVNVCQPDGTSACSATPGDPQAEACNSIDDDCDGDTDEDVGGGVCTSDLPGACADGTLVCAAGQLNCEPVNPPGAETCDGSDEDCDGETDEGFNVGQACTAGVGACEVGGILLCDGNGDTRCSGTPTDPNPETCDAIDNDCDGSTDETFNVGDACDVGVGACAASGNIQCDGNGGEACSAQPGNPVAETCNGVDDDCDGTVDEGTGGANCNTGVPGVCGPGVEACVNGALQCQGNEQPGAETCDEADNDCDGNADEGFNVGNICSAGVGACQSNGAIICDGNGGSTCSATPGDPQPETCNDADDDCDGSTDEGTGKGDACNEGVGACAANGVNVCDGNGGVTCNAQPGQPQAEVCNDADDDCDGSADEGLGLNELCEEGVGACASSGITVCDGNGGITCDAQPGQPEAEVCDENDNDCDGSVDEGLGIGDACNVGVGACNANGVNVCDGLGGVRCSATPDEPKPETCNGADDDCDGSTDEKYGLGEACNAGVGACANAGEIACDGNGGAACDAQPGNPVAESCDGVDNDCDAQTDEGLGLGEACNEGVGACAVAGVNVCDDNGGVTCSAQPDDPKVESCNGIDDDCDGQADEKYGLGEACTVGEGACANAGQIECDASGDAACNAEPGNPVAETCDEVDNDCDGSTDEGLGLGEACNEGVGACAANGVNVCDGNGAVTCSATPGDPQAETCNGLDDDCDGTVDEGTDDELCQTGQQGVCSQGRTACVAGQIECQPNEQPGAEVCDEKDNDCDGSTDEGTGAGEACNEGVGACNQQGVNVCNPQGGVTCSATPSDPQNETCNDVDDDCDGSTDEGTGKGDACNEGVGACAANGVNVCDGNGGVTCNAEPGQPVAETCNTADDDCDGNIDEGTGVDEPCEAGVGACFASGISVCDGNGGVTCDAQPLPPSDEACDDIDNDCDGTTDEGFGKGDACSEGVGACAADGVNVCDGLGGVTCNAVPGSPNAEVCDEADNDCDGDTDEGLGLGEACNEGVGACAANGVNICDDNGGVTCSATPGDPQGETCNGGDDDCDGNTDEGTGGDACQSGQPGACGPGTNACVNGALVCEPNAEPGAETCNEIDDDCDGNADEGTGAGEACNEGVGACAANGVNVCDGNGGVTCSATPGDPQGETCNGADDDCDGNTDEGTGGDACQSGQPGACGPGTNACVNGALVCEPNAEPGAETCNEIDDDCDGSADEGTGAGEACNEGVGACAANGVNVCDGNGGVTCSATPGDPQGETCNGADDDCDGNTDEGTGGDACQSGQAGACGPGTNACVNGALVCEPNAEPGAETCNGADDDCDGSTDEGFNVGDACNEGVGACADAGQIECDGNGGATCNANPGQPAAEVCDEADNDCDGTTDEGTGVGDACNAGVGACAMNGVNVCDGNGGVTCSATTGDPQAEACNGIDDDCDGTVDEGTGGDACQSGQPGACGPGTNACVDGALVCQPNAEPVAETCNEIDDDCDGSADEGTGAGEACNEGVGACAANGVNVCDGNGGVTCSATPGDPQAETCNAADDDCDGNTDEGTGGDACQSGQPGACGPGTNACVNGALVCEPNAEPGAETCNEIDDDCDGSADEGTGAGEACNEGVGACAANGVNVCDGNGGVTCSATPGDPQAETCNAADDDCDGNTDEGTGGDDCQSGQPGACGPGTNACVNGALVCEPNAQPGAETCNAADDDCDGNTDEGFNVGDACNEGVGACANAGQIECDGNGGATCNANPGQPGAEICNEADDDCDGETDEGLGLGEMCSEGVGACAANGVNVCDGNGAVTCSATTGDPQAETCNGIDDDCDGTVDEGTGGDACQSGQPGACGPGTNACVDGALVCQPNAEPGAEVCNEIDDDCDGQEDEGTRVGEACNEGVGACAANGVNVCDGNGGVTCSATPGDPQAETCNAADDDCDGNTDEGTGGDDCQSGQPGACGPGTNACVNGALVCQPNAQPGDETCNAADDDCDGNTDEGFNVGDACNEGVGACADAGQIECDGNGGATCNAEPGNPAAETCNDADDDCDGSTDEGLGKGDACSEGVGACAADGMNVCDGNGGVTCDAEPGQPADEVCDGVDNDCDGNIDEGTDGDACNSGMNGVCADGTTVCEGGNLACEPNQQPADETCDAIDNDCDGSTDEGFGLGEECNEGQGACAAHGNIVCDGNGGATCDAEPGQPGAETCNAADDDCDGSIDEGFNVGDACNEGQGACMAMGVIVCEDGAAVCDADGGDPDAEICDGIDNDCDGQTDENSPVRQFAADEYAANGHAVWLPNFYGDGARTRLHFNDDAVLTVRDDGTASLVGNATVFDGGVPGEVWFVETQYVLRGQGPDFGGPKIERPALQPPAVTDLWFYYDLTEGTVTRGDLVASLVQRPADGRFPFQFGMAANGKNANLGASVWFNWSLTDDGEPLRNGVGDININLDPLGVCEEICDIGNGGPAPEDCNNSDDDCDGVVDEGFGVGGACIVGEGECAAEGAQECGPDGEVVCDAMPGDPADETCDYRDNDCDGTTDEGFGLGDACNEGVGACAADGEVTCDANGGTTCDAEPGDPQDEVCNDADDDCDGTNDEGLGLGDECTVGVGACGATGENVCDGNGGVTCNAEPGQPAAEVCDGIDNDCDGNVDEGTGLGDACNVGVGACAADGVNVCDGNGGVVCNVQPGEPQAETCNDADDDCDGSTDEGLGLGDACNDGVGACAADGVNVCDGNGGVTCNAEPGQPNAETCNEADDDCDGNTDEGLGLGDACNEGVGACAADGVNVCDGNGGVTCNAEPGQPNAETCNDADDDCDGSTDEGTGKGDACNEGVGACAADGVNVCDGNGGVTCNAEPGQPNAETCNELDDDCDGSIDEDTGKGDACNEGVGACAADGVNVCDGNGGVTCNAEPGQPNAETCNDADDDCDGSIDEDTGKGDACNEGVGACAADGENVCDGNGGVTCNAEPGQPGDETCNDADDDCDGNTDEGLGLGEACNEGMGACAADGVNVCDGNGGVTCNAEPGQPGAEICNDADDDCDGNTDEGLGLGEECSAGEGACQVMGEQVCGDDGQVTCNAEPGEPMAELCDGLDNDCDGATDEEGPRRVYAASEFMNGHALWLPGLYQRGKLVRMKMRDGGELVIADGMARLTGTAYIFQNSGGPGAIGEEWDVDIKWTFRGVGDEFGGPKTNRPEQTPEVTANWEYYDMVAGESFVRRGNMELRLTQMPADGRYPFQIGHWANMMNANYGGASWFFWAKYTDGELVSEGRGDVNLDLEAIDSCEEICDPAAGEPQAETCDGRDNDCDGVADEGYDLGEVCVNGEGACGAIGETVCNEAGDGVVCDAEPGAPQDEICDDVDNDCDNSADEGLGLGEACNAGEGACAAAGETVCDENGGVTCNAEPGEPQNETCDALDNDCDGSTDEGLGLGDACTAGQGACAAQGENICDGDGGVACSAEPGQPQAETCDGIDNDCDGNIDEGFGLGDVCNAGVGACAVQGTVICDGNGGATCDADPVQPGAELCDDLDNDCDGFTDEGFGVGERCAAGQGQCRNVGERVCDGAGGVVCDAEPGAPSDELCDEEDNDCDGLIDEDFDLDGDCEVGIGECRREGQRICGEDDVVAGLGGNLILNGSFENPRINRAWTVVQEMEGWTTIAGNGIEIQRINDAQDGEQYVELDSHPTPGGGCMMQVIPVDVGGIYRLGISHSARPNVGDNRVALYWDGVEVAELDADGRGLQNTNWTRHEFDVTGNGNNGTLVICDVTNDRDTLGGFVDAVTLEMVEGIMCDAEPGEPEDEACDGLDNDCDGYTDEDLGIGDECQVGVGACAAIGAFQCDDNGNVICAGMPGNPEDEACDDVDNDCDGVVDEGACEEEPPCEGEAPGTRVYRVSAWDDDEYALYLPNWNQQGHRTDMLFRDDATFTVRPDGTASLRGTAFVNSLGGGAGQLGEEWDIAMDFELRGTGPQHGGPYRERPNVQPPELTDLWTYYNLVEGTFTRGDVVATLSQYPENGRFPFQMGQWANGRSNTFGASNWYRWNRRNADGSHTSSIGDMNINLDELCESPEVDPCEAAPEGTTIYQVTAWDENEYGLYLPNWNQQGHRTDMLFRDGATFTVNADGSAQLRGTAYVNSLGGGAGQLNEEWEVAMNFQLRGTGPQHGGPYRERPNVQPPEVTDLWTYFNLVDGTLTRGNVVATLSQYPENGRFPFQMGQWANGRSDTFGASNWYRWTRRLRDGGQCPGVQSSIGDMNINLDPLCVDECEPSDEVCNQADDDCDGDIDEGLDCDGAPQCPQRAVLDFETDAEGQPIEAGADLSDAYAGYGARLVTTDRNGQAMSRGIAFDSANPTGGDADLGAPNRDFGGPGQGNGGRQGQAGENNAARGNLLIRAENITDNNGDGLVDVPDDHGQGARFAYTFDTAVCVYGVDLLDIEDRERGATFQFYGANGALIDTISGGGLGNNSYERLDFEVCGVRQMKATLIGSGAIDNIEFCADPNPPIDICEVGEAYGVTEYAANGHAFWLPDFDGDGRLVKMHMRDDAQFTIQGNLGHLTGTAFRTDNDDEYTFDIRFNYRGQGPEFGGPKIERAQWQTPEVTDLWRYFDMAEATLMHDGLDVVTLTQMPADGRYPLQVGMTANGKNQGLGMSSWFTWVRENPEGRHNGRGDINVNLANACE